MVSKDGTPIAYERIGEGPPVILVGGGLDDGTENAPLARELARRFTVVNYARRGRGESGDTPPYAVRREVEDLDALVTEVGGPAFLYGVSSGGALALEAAALGVAVGKVAVYEVPYLVGEGMVAAWREYVARLGEALGRDDRDAALELFMRLAGSSDEEIAGARGAPVWPALLGMAHTLAYDAACLGDGPPPKRLAEIGQPVLVLTGGGLGGLPGFFDEAADALAAILPHRERRTIEGTGHVADAGRVAPVLSEFFTR